MNKSRNAVMISIAVLAVFFGASFLLPYESWTDIALHPWRLLWRSHAQLNATLIEVSENDGVKAVGERILQPFGGVKLQRIVSDDKPADKPKP